MSRDSVVTILQRLGHGLDCPGLDSRLEDPPRLLLNGYLRILPWVKRPWRAAELSYLSSTKVNNERSCTPASSVCVRGVHKNCIFIFRLPFVKILFDITTAMTMFQTSKYTLGIVKQLSSSESSDMNVCIHSSHKKS